MKRWWTHRSKYIYHTEVEVYFLVDGVRMKEAGATREATLLNSLKRSIKSGGRC